MKRPRITKEVLSGLKHMAEVARMARTIAPRPDVAAALRWIDTVSGVSRVKDAVARAGAAAEEK